MRRLALAMTVTLALAGCRVTVGPAREAPAARPPAPSSVAPPMPPVPSRARVLPSSLPDGPIDDVEHATEERDCPGGNCGLPR